MPTKASERVAKPGKTRGSTLERPGREHAMSDQPEFVRTNYKGADKLLGKVALITGGDSGIGRAVSIAYAKEGADLVIVYREDDKDARITQQLVQAEGRRCAIIEGDIGNPDFCKRCIDRTIKEFKRLDILINNAAEQHPKESLEEITPKQLQRTFATNIFGPFYLTGAAMKHLKKYNGTIINTVSVVAYRGNPKLLDYSSTKGALVAFTRSLSKLLAKDGIRVNAVAPGPIWTPLIPSTFADEKVEQFGKDTPMGRAGQPYECAGAYVYLASDDATYVTGQVIHINGGDVVNA